MQVYMKFFPYVINFKIIYMYNNPVKDKIMEMGNTE